MKELSEIVNRQINDMIRSGKLEEIITTKVEAAIVDSVTSATRSYSDFSKMLTEKIEISLQTACKDITIPAYNNFINQIILDKFTKILQINGAKHLAKLVEESLPPITKLAKFSDIMGFIRDTWQQPALEDGKHEIEISSRESDEGNAIYVTINNPIYADVITVVFYKFGEATTWHIGYINENGKPITGKATNAASTSINDVLAMLFRYYAMQTEFENDDEFCNLLFY